VSTDPPEDLANLSMRELFRVEAENQVAILTRGLLELEQKPATSEHLAELMRAAHSLKGAARIVGLEAAVQIAHALEDCFVLAQRGKLVLRQPEVDLLLRGTDELLQLARQAETPGAGGESAPAAETQPLLRALADLAQAGDAAAAAPPTPAIPDTAPPAPEEMPPPASVPPGPGVPERVVRLTTENLNRLLGLAGESLVEARWMRPFADSLQRLKRQQNELGQQLEELRRHGDEAGLPARTRHQLAELAHKAAACQQLLADRLQELDLFDRRSAQLSQRLYLEVLRTRMRPFSDGVRRFPRMVRDLAHSLGKKARLEIIGESVPVDRDLLERLESPLAHLLRNAVDHGCETPEQRHRLGKPREGTIRLEARHSAGQLLVTVADDGPGVPLELVREAARQRNLADPAAAEKFTAPELLDFLCLPGFTLKETVTEISGRGVGLDVVQNMVRGVRGHLRISTQPGQGLQVQLQLPLTLSVLRALLVEVDGEPYAFPLNQITRALRLPRAAVETLEGRHHFHFAGRQVALVTAHQVFDAEAPQPRDDDWAVVVLGNRNASYGVLVDRFLGERELVVQPLDARLGKVNNISSAALLENGAPVLIVDVDDLLRSLGKLAAGQPLKLVPPQPPAPAGRRRKRILVVDDSLIVRELMRKLLASRGYLTDGATDGLDGWNAVRASQYDLVIADVDMPRLSGIELTSLIKQDPQLKSLPVMIISNQDRERDQSRGRITGADFYLTKSAYRDDALLQAVADLIGAPDA